MFKTVGDILLRITRPFEIRRRERGQIVSFTLPRRSMQPFSRQHNFAHTPLRVVTTVLLESGVVYRP